MGYRPARVVAEFRGFGSRFLFARLCFGPTARPASGFFPQARVAQWKKPNRLLSARWPTTHPMGEAFWSHSASLHTIKTHVELLLNENLFVDASKAVARGIIFDPVS